MGDNPRNEGVGVGDEDKPWVEAMTASDQQGKNEISNSSRRGVLDLGTHDTLLDQNKLITQQIELLTI
ncbi:hypothetical protein Lal_00037577 [Lupinus albus]|nr:hypothetical protein Lal_00037577 [Lupinus albus]